MDTRTNELALLIRRRCSSRSDSSAAAAAFVTQYYSGNVEEATMFLTKMLAEQIVILQHQAAFVEWWHLMLEKYKMSYSIAASHPRVSVFYAQPFVCVDRSSCIGLVYYPVDVTCEVLCSMMLARAPQDNSNKKFGTILDIPFGIVKCLLLHSSTQLCTAFKTNWLDSSTYDHGMMDVFTHSPDMLEIFYSENFVVRAHESLSKTCDSLGRGRPNNANGRNGFSKLLIPSTGKALQPPLPPHNTTDMISWFSRTRKLSSRCIVLGAFLLLSLEVHKYYFSLIRDKRSKTTIDTLMRLFPLCMAIIREDVTSFMIAHVERIEVEFPGILDIIQRVADVVCITMIDPINRQSINMENNDNATYVHQMISVLRNIMVCIEPLLEHAQIVETMSLIRATGPTTAARKRQQRFVYHSVEYYTPYEMTYTILNDMLHDVGEIFTFFRWMWYNAARLMLSQRQRPLEHISHEQLLLPPPQDPCSEKARALLDQAARYFKVLCFFSPHSPTSALKVSYYSLVCTFNILSQRFKELGLDNACGHYIGRCQLGPYLVLHKDSVFMIRQALFELAHTSDSRCFEKNTPFYTYMLRTYYTRYVIDRHAQLYSHVFVKSGAMQAARIEQQSGLPLSQQAVDTLKMAMFEPLSLHGTMPIPPALMEANVFAHMCFVSTFSDWFCIPTVAINGRMGHRGVPDPESLFFGITRFIHRIVDLLQSGGSQEIRASAHKADYYIDDDASALTAIQSYMQLYCVHTLASNTLADLIQLFNADYALRKNFPYQFELLLGLGILSQQIGGMIRTNGGSSCDAYVTSLYTPWLISPYTPDTNGGLFSQIILPNYTRSSIMPLASTTTTIAIRRKRRRASMVSFKGGVDVELPPATFLGLPSCLCDGGSDDDNLPSSKIQRVLPQATATVAANNAQRQPPPPLPMEGHVVSRIEHTGNPVRIPLVPDQQIIDSLSTHHPLRKFAAVASKHDMVACVNWLIYSMLASNIFSSVLSKRILCDMLVHNSTPLTPTIMFSKQRYCGKISRVKQNFVFIRRCYEDVVFNSPHINRDIVYSEAEPCAAFVKLLRHIDFRVTCGDQGPGKSINSVIDAMTEIVPTHVLFNNANGVESVLAKGIRVDNTRPVVVTSPIMFAENVDYKDDDLPLDSNIVDLRTEFPVYLEKNPTDSDFDISKHGMFESSSLILVSSSYLFDGAIFGSNNNNLCNIMDLVQRTSDTFDYSAHGDELFNRYSNSPTFPRGTWLSNARAAITAKNNKQ